MMTMLRTLSVLLAMCVASCVLAASCVAQVAFEWEVIAEPGVQAAAMHDWVAAMTRQDVGQVRLRTAPTVPSPYVEQGQGGAVRVVAVLTTHNTLQLPNMTVPLSELHRLHDWMDGVRKSADAAHSADSASTAVGPPMAFGLSAVQLVDLRRTLSVPMNENTVSRPAHELMKVVRRLAGIPIQLTPAASAVMRERYDIQDALQDVSLGTATAAILRPLGLVLVPSSSAGQLELTVMEFKESNEFWPVGWPPDRPAHEVAPQLFEYLPVDIDDVSLAEALAALQSRLQMPLLFDYNGMARHDLNISQVRVTIQPTRTYYKRALDRVLYAARLRAELRVDEAGKPFLWIAPHTGAPKKK